MFSRGSCSRLALVQADDLNSERDSTNPHVSQAQYPATEELKLYQARLEDAKAKAVILLYCVIFYVR